MAVDFFSYGYDTMTWDGIGRLTWQDMNPQIGLSTYAVRSAGDWKVTAVSGAERTVSISAGRGAGMGVIDKTVANDTIQLDPIESGSRWDLIACRRDLIQGVSSFIKITGGATPVIPGARLSGPGTHDQPLALVQVTAGQAQPTGFIDLRTWVGDGGGMVANHDLVRSFLNKAGTRIHINGVDWVRRAGANDAPEWVADQAAADITTFGPGWTALTGNHKPRLVRAGGMVHLIGGVSQGAAASITNILTIPAGFLPESGSSMFVGSGVTSEGVAYKLVLGAGKLAIDRNYITGSFPVGSIVPVTASWPLS